MKNELGIACEVLPKDSDCLYIDFKYFVKERKGWEYEDYHKKIIKPFLESSKRSESAKSTKRRF